ncbi:MAG: nucleotidyl transferase AbiEii/AbiGii toxin family protein [Pyrinomonadaceae bacterium]
MEKAAYRRQVELMLNVLTEVAKEKCFALHGGTAINLFVREMPRLSVDIDLTYVPVEDRTTSLANIQSGLERIKESVERIIANVRVMLRPDSGKLQISASGVGIKLEVNPVTRGTLSEPLEMELCAKAQNDFEAFCSIHVVPLGQLYGSKICAALDRQHPRDLFDVKYLLKNEGFSKQIKTGFLLALLSSDRPIHEVISPNFQDQHLAMANQFSGMSDEEFSYKEYEEVRATMVRTIHESLTGEDLKFLLSFAHLMPDWDIYDFERFPAIVWKLTNLQKLKDNNPVKYREQYDALEKTLNAFNK